MEVAAGIHHVAAMGGIVLGDRGTIAMVRRSNSNGAWLFPKGHAEEGETDEETARREVAEETGLTDLELLGDLGTYERNHIKPDGTYDYSEMKHIHMFLFAAPHGAALAPTLEIEEAQWVPYQKVAQVCGNDRDRAWFATVYDRVREAIQRD
jgi:8-oxo-dGTP pyrophosphatase MutT (NUDIX family)